MELVVLVVSLALMQLVLWWIWRMVVWAWWRPRQMKAALEAQGLRGPPARFVMGNLTDIVRMRRSSSFTGSSTLRHDILLPTLLPEHIVWTVTYGKTFVILWGPELSIHTTDMDWIKEIFTSREASIFDKPSLAVQLFLEPLIGRGLVTLNGQEWSHRRRLISQAFHIETIKEQIKVMTQCGQDMINEWSRLIENKEGKIEIDVMDSSTKVACKIIAATQFGVDSDKKKQLFEDLDYLRQFITRYGHYLFIPGVRNFPSATFRKMRSIKVRVHNAIQELAQEWKDRSNRDRLPVQNLLDLLLEELNNGSLSMNEIVDECKTFFFAGQDTTAKVLSWACLLLAENTAWQDDAREEVLQACGRDPPDAHTLSKLRKLEMIIHETLRLYPPVVFIARAASKDILLDGIRIPKGTAFGVPILALHYSKELWGDDVESFNPARFSNGVAKACKNPLGYLPFTHGPRICVGQTFALMEAKCVLAMVLQHFKLSPSPNYCHAPEFGVTLRPGRGAQVFIEKV